MWLDGRCYDLKCAKKWASKSHKLFILSSSEWHHLYSTLIVAVAVVIVVIVEVVVVVVIIIHFCRSYNLFLVYSSVGWCYSAFEFNKKRLIKHQGRDSTDASSSSLGIRFLKSTFWPYTPSLFTVSRSEVPPLPEGVDTQSRFQTEPWFHRFSYSY